MDFQIRRISQWHHDVAVSIDGTRVDLGLHDEEQRKTLASTLREAADDLDPAATASHAAEVEALRSALADAVHLIETLVAHHGARLLPAGEERLEGYRAALKGDKP